MNYTLKEVCQLLEMSEHTVRYYTDLNLFEVKRDQHNYRVFDEQALDWLRGVKYLRGLGMSLESIKKFHDLCMQEGDEAIVQRLQILQDQLVKANEELKQAQNRVQYLKHKIEKEEKILKHIIPDQQNPSKKKY